MTPTNRTGKKKKLKSNLNKHELPKIFTQIPFLDIFSSADFRINRFCNENLVIGNEIVLPDSKSGEVSDNNVMEDSNEIDVEGSAVEGKGEPRAEARVQLESNLHQFTNLKIIKGTPEDIEETNRKKNEQKRRRQGIYSQVGHLIQFASIGISTVSN